MAGLVGSQLVDPNTDAVCNITSVVSDTTLRCENPEPDDSDPNTIPSTRTRSRSPTASRTASPATPSPTSSRSSTPSTASPTTSRPRSATTRSPSRCPSSASRPARSSTRSPSCARWSTSSAASRTPRSPARVAGQPGRRHPRPPDRRRGRHRDARLPRRVRARRPSSDVRWRDHRRRPGHDWVSAAADTVGPGAGNVALTVTAPGTDHDGFVSIGSEYTIEVEWTEGGEPQSAALPPRTPQSLQSLAKQVSQVLGLPDGALEFELVDADDPAKRTLRINLGYGICSDPAPSFETEDPCAGMPAEPAPTANLAARPRRRRCPRLVGLDDHRGPSTCASRRSASSTSASRSTAARPSSTARPDSRRVSQVDGTDLGITASIGPVNATIGAGGGTTGTANDDSATTLVDADRRPSRRPKRSRSGRPSMNTTTGEECFVTRRHRSHARRVRPLRVARRRRVPDRWARRAPRRAQLRAQRRRRQRRTRPRRVGGPRRRPDRCHRPRHVPGRRRRLRRHRPELRRGRLRRRPERHRHRPRGHRLRPPVDGARNAGDAHGVPRRARRRPRRRRPHASSCPPTSATKLEDALLDPSFLVLAIPELLEEVEDGLRDAADAGAPAAIADPLRIGADARRRPSSRVPRRSPNRSPRSCANSPIRRTSTTSPRRSRPPDAVPAGRVNQSLSAQEPSRSPLVDPRSRSRRSAATTTATPATGDTLADLTDIGATLTFGQEVVAGTGINLGLEGLPLSIEAGVEGFAEWHVTVGAGVSRDDGPYISARPGRRRGPVTAGVRFNDQGPADCAGPIAGSVEPEDDYDASRCLRGRLAFLFVTAIDQADPTQVGDRAPTSAST